MMEYSLGNQTRSYTAHDTISISSNLPQISSLPSSKLKQLQFTCRFHPQQPCSNYCIQTKCFQPLCSQCIEQHVVTHKKSGLDDTAIKSMRGVRKDCVAKLSRIIQQLMRRLSLLQQPRNPDMIMEELEERLEAIKQQMHQLVQFQIGRIRESIKVKVTESESVLNGLREIHLNLESIIGHLRQTGGVICQGRNNGKLTVPDALQNTITLNQVSLMERFQKDSQAYMSKIKRIDFQVTYNQELFRTALIQSVKVGNTNNAKSLNSSAISFNLIQKKGRSKSGSKSNHQFQSNEDNSYVSVFPTAPSPQTQSPNKILHFFQTASSNLHLIFLSASKSKKYLVPTHQIRKLDGFIVPTYHASLLSQQNESIFISGGIMELMDSTVKSPLLMKYNIKSQQLKKDFAKVKERSSHTLCQDGEYLYIVGGYGQSVVSQQDSNVGTVFETSLERIHINKGTIDELPSSKWGGANISFIMQNKYLIKACEEGIEAFSLKNKQWNAVQIKSSMKGEYVVYKSMGYAIITENIVMVYGGYTDKQESTAECFSWKIQEKAKGSGTLRMDITRLPCRLPVPQGFSNNPAILDRKNLYAIQNIDDDGTGCVQDERRLIRYEFGIDGEWKITKLNEE